MKIKKTLSIAVLSALLGCQTQLHANNLQNFNENNAQNLIRAFQNNSVHIIQLGDSHTAADHMTDALRTQLQNRLGNGGMGWGMPMYFAGQRLSRFGYDNQGWQPISSRSQRDENYTLGGLLATPQFDGATLTIKAKQNEQAQKITVSLRQASQDGAFIGSDAQGRRFTLEAPVKNNTWQTVSFNAQLPFTLRAQNANHSAIGGWWAQNQSGRGAVVSALGINGGELSYWDRWNSTAWRNELATIAPQLVILAYGTNEGYNNSLDVDHAREILTEKIRQIRSASPKTAIMIISAPESLKNTAGSCGTRPIKLDAVQNMQYQVAQSSQTLFWNWQQAMGGECSMKSWINRGDAARDGVHFSASGYQKLGQMLANDLLELSNLSPSTPNTQPNSGYSPNSAPISQPQNYGSGSICMTNDDGTQTCRNF